MDSPQNYHVMATLPNFLVPRCKVWLTPTAQMTCSNTANIERNTWTQSEFWTWQNYVRQQESRIVYALCPGDRQTSCKFWLTSRWCSNEDKMRNPLKFAGVPQTRQPISAVSRPKFNKLSGLVEEILLLFNIFSDCR